MFRFPSKILTKTLPLHFRFFSSTFSDPLISASQAYLCLSKKNSLFIDVRDPQAFKESHIPGAQNLNEIFSYLATSDEQGVKALTNTFETLFRKAGITGKEHIITYEDCLKTRFGASCRGYFLFNLLGHSNVNILQGGYEAWVNAKYPTTNELPQNVKEGTFKARWSDEFYAGKEDLIKALQAKDNKNNKVVLLDVRDIDEWNAETSSPYGKDFAPRKGRIPKAVHVVWKDFMENKDGATFIKDPKDIVDICRQKGIEKDSDVIVYCFKGARASNTLIALKRAGFQKVKNYFASWNEWSRDPSLPIEGSK